MSDIFINFLNTIGKYSNFASFTTGVSSISAFIIFILLYLISKNSRILPIRKTGLYLYLSTCLGLGGLYQIFIFLIMMETNPSTALDYYRWAYFFGIPAIPIFLNVVLNLTIDSYGNLVKLDRIKKFWKNFTRVLWYPMWVLMVGVAICNVIDIFFNTNIFFQIRENKLNNSFIPLIPEVSDKYTIWGYNPVWITWSVTIFFSVGMETAYLIRVIWFDKPKLIDPSEYFILPKNKKEILKFLKILKKRALRTFVKGLFDSKPTVKWIKTFTLFAFIAFGGLLFQGIKGYNWNNSFPISSYTNWSIFFAVTFIVIGDVFEAREKEIKAYTEAFTTNFSTRMLRTVGHQLGQPIVSIKGFFHRFRKDMENRSKYMNYLLTEDIVNNYLNDIKKKQESIELIIKIINDLKTQAGIFKTNIRPVSLNNIIKEVLSLVISSYPDKIIERDLNFDPDIKSVKIDPDQMRNILKNIFENSIDAIENEGTIKVNTKLQSRNIFIKVSDNGKGIPSNVIDKVTDPFFTTKTKGSGLGLSIVENFLNGINGSFKIESDEGKGTSVEIIFPMKK